MKTTEFKSVFVIVNQQCTQLLSERLRFHGYNLTYDHYNSKIIHDCYLYQSKENPKNVLIAESKEFYKLIKEGYIYLNNRLDMMIPIMNMNNPEMKDGIGKWFVYKPTGKMIYNSFSHPISMIDENHFYVDNNQKINELDFHEVSLEEIIEFYRTEPLGYQTAFIRINENMNLLNLMNELSKRGLKLVNFNYKDNCIMIEDGYISTANYSMIQNVYREVRQVDAFLDIAAINLFNDYEQHFCMNIKGKDGFMNDAHCNKNYMMIPNYRKSTPEEITDYYDLPF